MSEIVNVGLAVSLALFGAAGCVYLYWLVWFDARPPATRPMKVGIVVGNGLLLFLSFTPLIGYLSDGPAFFEKKPACELSLIHI